MTICWSEVGYSPMVFISFRSCKWKYLANHLTSDHWRLRCIGRVRYCDIKQIYIVTSLVPIILRMFLRIQRLVACIFPSLLSYHSLITGSDLRRYHHRACLIFSTSFCVVFFLFKSYTEMQWITSLIIFWYEFIIVLDFVKKKYWLESILNHVYVCLLRAMFMTKYLLCIL